MTLLLSQILWQFSMRLDRDMVKTWDDLKRRIKMLFLCIKISKDWQTSGSLECLMAMDRMVKKFQTLSKKSFLQSLKTNLSEHLNLNTKVYEMITYHWQRQNKKKRTNLNQNLICITAFKTYSKTRSLKWHFDQQMYY